MPIIIVIVHKRWFKHRTLQSIRQFITHRKNLWGPSIIKVCLIINTIYLDIFILFYLNCKLFIFKSQNIKTIYYNIQVGYSYKSESCFKIGHRIFYLHSGVYSIFKIIKVYSGIIVLVNVLSTFSGLDGICTLMIQFQHLLSQIFLINAFAVAYPWNIFGRAKY